MKEEIINLDWWLSYEGGVVDNFYGGNRGRHFSFTIDPLNSGTQLRFTFLFDKDMHMSGTMDEVYLEIRRKEGQEWERYTKTYTCGDSTFDSWIYFAVALLKSFRPNLLDKKELKVLVREGQ